MTTASPSSEVELARSGSRSRSSSSTMARFSARLMRPSRVRRVGLPRQVSTRWASPIMLPRLSGSGWTWETKVTEVNSANPSRKRSDRRDSSVFVPAAEFRRCVRHGLRPSNGYVISPSWHCTNYTAPLELRQEDRLPCSVSSAPSSRIDTLFSVRPPSGLWHSERTFSTRGQTILPTPHTGGMVCGLPRWKTLPEWDWITRGQPGKARMGLSGNVQ